jgi:hypothetical protein
VVTVKNVKEPADLERSRTVLTFEGAYQTRIVQAYILEAPINRPEATCSCGASHRAAPLRGGATTDAWWRG